MQDQNKKKLDEEILNGEMTLYVDGQEVTINSKGEIERSDGSGTKTNSNEEFSYGGAKGTKKSTTPTDLDQIKHFLHIFKDELINLTIVVHSKESKYYQEANYRPKNQTLFVDKKVLDEIKKTKIDLVSGLNLSLSDSTPLKNQNNTLKVHYPNFKINYENQPKNKIKEIVGKIGINALETLQLRQLDLKKVDKYGNLLKTNYKKSLNIVYYRDEDLKYIKFFLKKATQGYRVKKLRSGYLVNLNKKKSKNE